MVQDPVCLAEEEDKLANKILNCSSSMVCLVMGSPVRTCSQCSQWRHPQSIQQQKYWKIFHRTEKIQYFYCSIFGMLAFEQCESFGTMKETKRTMKDHNSQQCSNTIAQSINCYYKTIIVLLLELQTKVCEDFTITEKAPTRAFSLVVPSRDFILDC